MNKLILLFLILPLTTFAQGVSSVDPLGTWESLENNFLDWTYNRFSIKPNKTVQWEHKNATGQTGLLKSKAEDFSEQDGIYTIAFRNSKNEHKTKVVLSGWSSTSTDMLFGYVFIYRAGENGERAIINGFPLTFKRLDGLPLYEKLLLEPANKDGRV